MIAPQPVAVPLLARFRVLQQVRVAGVGLVLGGVLVAAVAQTSVLATNQTETVLVTLLYAVVVLAAAVSTWLPSVRRRAVVVFSALLLVDGAWLATVVYLTGWSSSPLRYLVLLHVGAVALLGSARSGVKVALWHSLLVYAVQTAQHEGVLTALGGPDSTERAVVFVVVLWLVALSTSSLSAVNERELWRRKADLEGLTAFAEQVERATTPPAVAALLAESVVQLPGFARAVVLGGPEGQLARLAGADWSGTSGPDRKLGRPGTSALVSHAHAVRKTQLRAPLDPDTEPWLHTVLPSARAVLVVPLTAEGRALGALVAEYTGETVAPRYVAVLEQRASYTALALRNAWLLDQVTRLAATDGLTKIANRRSFESTLERELARAARHHDAVSLVMLDIDHFKRLNDTYGHQAGDEVLRNVAAALVCECRDFDTPARFGGEEFAVILPGCRAEEAVRIADRLRSAVSKAPAVTPVTASAGVATYPVHAADAEALVRAADLALYESKNAGRNRTTGAPEARTRRREIRLG